jgi:nucleoside-diphosphate-sugar epimerase
MASVVFGASGVVGAYIVKHLAAAGEETVAVSRKPHGVEAGITWLQWSIERPVALPPCEVIYSTIGADQFADAFPLLVKPGLKRVIVFSTSSIMTKMNSENAAERTELARLADAERSIQEACERAGIGWTILRPTLIYDEGRDRNITRMSRTIRKLRFMPLAGSGSGKRQPVHAEDLAIAAIAASRRPSSADKMYVLAGVETISYREMVGRVFDGLRLRRVIVPLPPILWKAAFTAAKPFFPGFNASMGSRMSYDMVFDTTPAQRDLGWRPRDFRPRF